uniref:Ubiquitin-like protease family profile domain-containing protein n=1 Tax=Tetranychus urticae TaxID=32264 RepID=A0A158P5B5_TETUR
MLTTLEIENLLKDVPWFNGVYALDQLPRWILAPSSVIINLDESYKPGSHWVAVYFDKNKVAHYFDSFGRQPQGNILTFIEANSDYYIYNPIKYQGNLSIACGYFCILFVLSVNSLNSFYKLFRQCKHENNEKTLFKQLKKYLI